VGELRKIYKRGNRSGRAGEKRYIRRIRYVYRTPAPSEYKTQGIYEMPESKA
jgi:hypothetical protein